MKQYDVAATAEPMILAALYADGIAADRIIADIAYGLRAEGLAVAGLVQRNQFVIGRRRCTMEMEELASRTVLTISEDRGPLARGCRLDRAALSKAESLLMDALAIRPDVVIINKFGKSEAEGGGLREPISCAAQLGVPTVVGVPYRNLEAWRAFAGEFAEEVTAELEPIRSWLARRGLPSPLTPFSSAFHASTGGDAPGLMLALRLFPSAFHASVRADASRPRCEAFASDPGARSSIKIEGIQIGTFIESVDHAIRDEFSSFDRPEILRFGLILTLQLCVVKDRLLFFGQGEPPDRDRHQQKGNAGDNRRSDNAHY